jgi:aspartokinase-like uncharacterized kinase
MHAQVAKVGGSLLAHENAIEQLASWLKTQSHRKTLLIAGGGRLADEVRRLDERFQFDQQLGHWLAIRTMSMHGEVVAAKLALGPPLSRMEEVQDWLTAPASDQAKVLDPESWLRFEQPPQGAEPLPVGWSVTSDSIAAYIAQCIPVAEVTLLKSTLPSSEQSITCSTAAEMGFVDAHLPEVARGLTSLRAVNLRDMTFPELELLGV